MWWLHLCWLCARAGGRRRSVSPGASVSPACAVLACACDGSCDKGAFIYTVMEVVDKPSHQPCELLENEVEMSQYILDTRIFHPKNT